MKKQAQLGQWKTPPNQVYAVPPTISSEPTTAASLGTKMQLMGLGQQPKRPPPPPFSSSGGGGSASAVPIPIPSTSSSSSSFSQPFLTAPPPVPFPNNTNGTFTFGTSGASDTNATKSTSTKSMLLAPNASPITASPFDMMAVEEASPTHGPKGKGRKPGSSLKKAPAGSPGEISGEGEASSPPSKSSSAVGTAATPEEKEKMLAHSRMMARLRRQQQRVLTDSLEAEFFELCVSAAYLKAALKNTPSNVPLPQGEVERIYQEATERSFEAIDKSIPTARSQELKTQVSAGKLNMPQAHVVQSLRVDDAAGMHLAVTVGSRRESFSFSTERRKGALSWATAGVKQLYTEMNKDALPFVAVANCASGSPDADPDLANRLRLTPEQKDRIARLIPEAKTDMVRLVAAQRAADLLFTDHWLSLPKTDALMEHVKDTTTTEQMNKLISWSITNEAQIATLKLGTVKEPNATN